MISKSTRAKLLRVVRTLNEDSDQGRLLRHYLDPLIDVRWNWVEIELEFLTPEQRKPFLDGNGKPLNMLDLWDREKRKIRDEYAGLLSIATENRFLAAMENLTNPSYKGQGPWFVAGLTADEKRRRLFRRRGGIWKQLADVASYGYRERIHRCGSARCGKYFLAEGSKRRRIFHGPECGRYESAVRTMKRKREAARHKKLTKARRAVLEFQRRKHPPQGWRDYPEIWKPWVALRAGVTPKWVTRHRRALTE